MLKRLLVLTTAAAAALCLAACGGDDDGSEGEGETGFPGGSFNITLKDVTDGCFDGALKALILPTGDIEKISVRTQYCCDSAIQPVRVARIVVNFHECELPRGNIPVKYGDRIFHNTGRIKTGARRTHGHGCETAQSIVTHLGLMYFRKC